MNNEKTALRLAKNRKWLYKRLLDAKECLPRATQLHNAPWKFNAQARRLVSNNGKLALHWQIRQYPKRPISCENQQTTVGTVILKEIR